MKNVLIAGTLILGLFLGALVIFRQESNNSNSDSILGANPLTPADQPLFNKPPPPQQTAPSPRPPKRISDPTTFIKISASRAIIKTTKGDIEIKLYPEDAPKTVTNFATLAKNGYYEDLTFHRIVPGFVVQGGDPNGDGSGGISIYGPTFEDELSSTESASFKAGYKQGVVAMANRGPNTNGSQFFIMLEDNDNLSHNYTIFGKVTSGMEVVKKIQIGDRMLEVNVE